MPRVTRKQSLTCFSFEKSIKLDLLVLRKGLYLGVMKVFALTTMRFFRFIDDEALARYRAGYNECASEVSRYLMTADNVDQRLQTQILSHLALTYTQNKPTRTEQVEARIPTLLPATALPAMPSTTSHFNVLPSPPSSPLKARDKPLEVAASSAPVVIGNRVPAILVPSYARLHLLPFPPLQNSVGDTTVWRPW